MAEFPAFPLWTDAYLADTRHLTTEEHGAYLLLLMEAWRRPNCNLPDDDLILARLSGLTAGRWAEVRPVVMSFWQRDGRRKVWTQKRLSRERQFVAQKSQSQRDKATKRWGGSRKQDAAAVPGQSRGNAPTPTPTPTPTSTLETNVSNDATASEDVLRDPAKAMFDSGIRLLGEAGVTGAKARTLLGKWKRDHGAEAVIVALGRAQRESAIDPVSFCEGVLRFTKRSGQNALPQIGDERTTPDGRRLRYGGAIDEWVEVRE